MKLIKEHINFERNIDPKKAMDIGELNSIVRLLLLNPIDDYYKETFDDWINENPALANFIEYKGIDDIKNILCFETETICDEDHNLDAEEIEDDFIKVKPTYNYRGLDLTIGRTKLGKCKVIRYLGDTVSGFIARKEWIKPVVESNFQRNIEPKKAMSIGSDAEFKQFIKDEGLERQPMRYWLQLCVDFERTDLILYLLEKDFSPVENAGAPLLLACSRGRIDIIELLLDYVEKNSLRHLTKEQAVDIEEGALILNALANNHYDVIKHLLEKYDATVTSHHIKQAGNMFDPKYIRLLEKHRAKQASFRNTYRDTRK